MVILPIIMMLTLGVAWRAYMARNDGNEVLDAWARALVLVFVSVVGLLALGVTYGNVLGATATP
jgi:hypothetical protein